MALIHTSGDVQGILKPIESRIPDVGPIKEADQVKET